MCAFHLPLSATALPRTCLPQRGTVVHLIGSTLSGLPAPARRPAWGLSTLRSKGTARTGPLPRFSSPHGDIPQAAECLDREPQWTIRESVRPWVMTMTESFISRALVPVAWPLSSRWPLPRKRAPCPACPPAIGLTQSTGKTIKMGLSWNLRRCVNRDRSQLIGSEPSRPATASH